MDELKVKMADLVVSKAPNILSTLGLGSCLGITLYDPIKKIGGLAHIMLPDINAVKIRTNKAKFVNTAIEEMLQEMLDLGAGKKNIEAKIIGGAHMFGFVKSNVLLNVGERNVSKAREELDRAGIRIVAEDVGLDYGRSVFFHLADGSVKIATIAHGDKII